MSIVLKTSGTSVCVCWLEAAEAHMLHIWPRKHMLTWIKRFSSLKDSVVFTCRHTRHAVSVNGENSDKYLQTPADPRHIVYKHLPVLQKGIHQLLIPLVSPSFRSLNLSSASLKMDQFPFGCFCLLIQVATFDTLSFGSLLSFPLSFIVKCPTSLQKTPPTHTFKMHINSAWTTFCSPSYSTVPRSIHSGLHQCPHSPACSSELPPAGFNSPPNFWGCHPPIPTPFHNASSSFLTRRSSNSSSSSSSESKNKLCIYSSVWGLITSAEPRNKLKTAGATVHMSAWFHVSLMWSRCERVERWQSSFYSFILWLQPCWKEPLVGEATLKWTRMALLC